MNLIKDDKPVEMLRKVELRISEFGPIRGKFQVKVQNLGFKLLFQRESQSRFASLARTKQRYGRKALQQVQQLGFGCSLKSSL